MLKFGNTILLRNTNWLANTPGAPVTPLPPYTLRLRYKDGVTPTFSRGTATQVSSSPNIWDLTYEYGYWDYLCGGHTDLLEVISGNTTGV